MRLLKIFVKKIFWLRAKINCGASAPLGMNLSAAAMPFGISNLKWQIAYLKSALRVPQGGERVYLGRAAVESPA